MLTVEGDIFHSLKRHLDYGYNQELLPVKVNSFASCNTLNTNQTFVGEFNRIVDELEIKINNVRNTVVFIDHDLFNQNARYSLGSYEELNPISSANDFPQFISMLILAFPEIHWVFMPGIFGPNTTIEGNLQKILENTKCNLNAYDFHNYNIVELNTFIERILSFSTSDLIALFDPCNLRNRIKQNMGNHIGSMPNRELCAAAIDEEISYALLNAYTTYRFGYRAWVVANLGAMRNVFNDKKYNVKLIFEDLYLNFPDEDPEYHLSELEKRDISFQGLNTEYEDVERILITVGHKNSERSKITWQKNISYLKHEFKGRFKILYKPLSGIFDLWRKSGKWKRFQDVPEKPEGFIWPSDHNANRDEENCGHSAPGRLLLIAEKLLERSKRILQDANCVANAIHAATLALEAKELLSCKTPTLAFETLSCQHQAEVEAECMFYGVAYDLDVKSRIKDIRKEVKAISKWFNSSAKKRSQLNAEITILSALAQRYRKYSQFEEENICLHANRKLTVKLWASGSPLRWLGLPFRAYINFLLQSLTRFTIVIFCLVFLFGTLYWSMANGNPAVEVSFSDSIIVSAKTFLAFQPPSLEFWAKDSANLKTSVAFTPICLAYFIFPAILGFIHLGVFISHLTMILM